MKKVFLVMQNKDAAQALLELRELSLLHVEHIKEPHGHHIAHLKEETQNLARVLDVLAPLVNNREQKLLTGWQVKVEELVKSFAERAAIEEDMAKRQALFNLWQSWGDFDPQDIRQLERRGLYVQLLEIPVKEIVRFSKNNFCQVIANQGSVARCAVVTQEKKELPFPSVELPDLGLRQMREEREKEEKRLKMIDKILEESASYYESLKKIYEQHKETLEYEEVKSGLGGEDQLAYLKAFVPVNQCERLRQEALKQHWGLLIEDPSPEDQVPTLLSNPRWIKLIEPVFGVINVLPGYKELDISLIFLIFFSMFFGILIGDAGYGALFLTATLFFHHQWKGKIKDHSPFFLMYVLSFCAMAWGVLTGTYFGTLLFAKIMKPLMAWLTENQNVQMVCFFIGAVHLTIAHGWRCLMKRSVIFSALAEIGWIIVIWGAFFLANAMVIGTPLAGVDINKAMVIVGAGALLIVVDIISRPQDGIFVGLVLSFFSFISAFTDVVSYIRLFAVGLAGVAVADAFNQMALSVGFGNVVSGIITALILVVGHLFNIVLCGFGILVHGLRLNVLEFSGHLGLEWAGFKYEPFRKNKQS